MHVNDYVKQILESKMFREKEYWAMKWFPERYSWIQTERMRTRQQSACTLEALKAAVKATGEPSFALPLARSLFRLLEDIAKEHEAEAVNETTRRPTRRPCATTSCEYGRRKPLEPGGPVVRRISYTTQRKIGAWNECNEKKFGIKK